MNSEETYWDPLLKLVCFSNLHSIEPTEKHLARLLEMEPVNSPEIRAMVSSFLLSEELISDIIESVERIRFNTRYASKDHLLIA